MEKKEVDALLDRFHLGQPDVSAGAMVFSSFFAAFSHVVLDAFMHADMRPFAPLSDANPLLGLVQVDHLYAWTGSALLFSLAAIGWLAIRKRTT